MGIIGLIAGLGYFFGNVLLSREKTYGWIIKIIGGIFWIIFLYQNENFIFMAATIMVVSEMFYGLYKWLKNKKNKTTKIDIVFNILSVLVVVGVVGYFALSRLFSAGYALETIIVVAEVAGTILLAQRNVLGWYSYIVMSACASILVIFLNDSPAVVLGILEFSSIFFYIQGIKRMKKA